MREHDRLFPNQVNLLFPFSRHEPPVVNEPIKFIRNDEEIVVINKPSSIPVWPLLIFLVFFVFSRFFLAHH